MTACKTQGSKEDQDFEYMKRKADRSQCPRRPDFTRLYSAYNKDKYGGRNGSDMFDQLKEVLEEYQVEWEDASIMFQEYEDYEEDTVTPFILVVITK